MKKKKSKSLILSYILAIVTGAIIGGIGGSVLGSLTKHSGFKGYSIIQGFIIMILTMFISNYFHIITHEAGHLIFGLLSGYQFVSYRIDSFTFIRYNGKWMLKRYQIPGTCGQCLMEPPRKDEQGYFPVKLYNFGGIVVNFIFSLLFTILAFLSSNWIFICIMMSSAVIGWIIFLTNVIPMKITGITNDGYNVFLIDKDPIAKESFYIQLDVNARMSKGQRMKDLPYELIHMEEETDLSNPMIGTLKLLEYYWYAEQRMFSVAESILQKLTSVEGQLIPLLKRMVTIEQIYLEIMNQNRQEVIDDLLTKELQTFLKKVKYDVHVKRIIYALELRKNANSEATRIAKQELATVSATYPVEGEAKLSLALATYLEDRLEEEIH